MRERPRYYVRLNPGSRRWTMYSVWPGRQGEKPFVCRIIGNADTMANAMDGCRA